MSKRTRRGILTMPIKFEKFTLARVNLILGNDGGYIGAVVSASLGLGLSPSPAPFLGQPTRIVIFRQGETRDFYNLSAANVLYYGKRTVDLSTEAKMRRLCPLSLGTFYRYVLVEFDMTRVVRAIMLGHTQGRDSQQYYVAGPLFSLYYPAPAWGAI